MGKYRRKQLRPRGRQSLPKELMSFGYHLVFSEGIETEPNYVNNIKEVIANNFAVKPGQIDIHPHIEEGSYSTLSLIQFAEHKTAEIIKKGITVDHVWIFYDKDDFSKDDFDNAYHKIEDKNQSGLVNIDGDPCDCNQIVWHACWSNESFELWPLLYFQSVRSAMSRKQYIDCINFHISDKRYGNYTKNNKNIHDMLTLNGGSIETAIKNGEAIDVASGAKPNPSTGVYKFAKHFIRYLNKGVEKNEKN